LPGLRKLRSNRTGTDSNPGTTSKEYTGTPPPSLTDNRLTATLDENKCSTVAL